MALSTSDRARLQAFLESTRLNTQSYLGYPVSKDFEFEDLVEFLRYPLNNLGDPFGDSTWRVDSRSFEREVITFFAELLRAPKNDWWGYVTNGGTEGNLYGLYLARELLPKGIVYYSQDTHYSVAKNLHFLGMRHIMIRSQKNGEMDYNDLRETLRARRDIPPIIFANIGTTMTEARDDLNTINHILDELAFSQRYVHSDAALCGGMAPFMEPRPAFDFADGADSISISGHKFFGSPIPCGIVLARKCNVDRIARSISYIGNLDTTITGSRNGFTPLVLWHTIRSQGVEGLAARVQHSLDTASYAETRMRNAGISAWRNPNAITVVFPQVAESVKQKWQLATANGQSHVICMPNVTRAQIDELVEDMLATPENVPQ
ncbi:histidine decarboxylase [Microbulbifer pacificus]|uniref:Histidine decarboxylase n=1 Tax=Microbulbifer pacificus TaxID=407164 RepID=A0AAU0MWS4_9GAMM|nr:histidine decarboxylase [Microbulbifer pacificus]WOX04331.1 histidine decarboxylase [Microbulbifer pacificus]